MLMLHSAAAQSKDLFQLAIDGSPKQLRQAIRNGADIKARNTYGETVLIAAASNNPDPAVISLLLEEGVELDARDRFGENALMHAASTSHNSGRDSV
jgi:ankyrin repeat protein